MCRETLLADLPQRCSPEEIDWIRKVLDVLYPRQGNDGNRQLAALFEDALFQAPCTFFPPWLDDLVNVACQLRPLARSITETSQEGKLLSLLLTLPEPLFRVVLKKFQSAPLKFDRETCRYDILLHAAPAYAKKQTFKPLLPYYALYLAAARRHDEELFTRPSYCFPTRKADVWKKGSEISEEKSGHEDDEHLDESVWEACRSFFSANTITTCDKGASSAEYLKKYFSVPFSRSETYRVACFLRLIAGQNEHIIALAKTFLPNIDDELDFDFEEKRWKFWIEAHPGTSNVEKSLAGSPFDSEGNKRTFFISLSSTKNIYRIYFYVNEAGLCSSAYQEDFTERLINSIEAWLKQFSIEQKEILDIVNRFSPTQYSLNSTELLLREDLRTVIEQLHIKNIALEEKRRAVCSSIQRRDGVSLKKLKDDLWDNAKNTPEIYESLLEKIQNYGYRENGVLFELIQNADDALRECGEPKKRCVTMILRNRTLSFSHYGRPINEKKEGTSGNNDLYSMLMLNRSEKESTSATGKLGLGFKSVFLLSEQPVIQSKALCFSIRNGIFPQEEERRLDKDDDEVTLFRLPIKSEIPDEEMEERIFSRVIASAALIPVFAHEIREIVISIDGREKRFAYDPDNPDTSVSGQGWIADANARVLCFSDPDSGMRLAVSLDAKRRARPFPASMPPLWHTLPTVSGLDWGLGYAINAPFSLNAGRSDIAPVKEDFDKLEAFGIVLGESLCDYARYVAANYPDAMAEHNHALWMVLGKGLESPEESLQGKIVRSLHAGGRGLSCWLRRDNVPCGIPEKWSYSLKDSPKWRTCPFPSANALRNFEQMVRELRRRDDTIPLPRVALVSEEQSSRLEALGFSVERMEAPALFTAFFDGLIPDGNLEPRHLSCLRHIREELPRQTLPFRVRTQAGTWEDIGRVLLPPDTPCECPSDFKEEQRRAILAPPDALLSEAYVTDWEYAETYRRLRNGYTVTSEELQGWITGLERPEQRKQALLYLQEGELSTELCASLRNVRQGWIRDIELVSGLLDSMTEIDAEHKKYVLMRLFPDKFLPLSITETDAYESEEDDTDEDIAVLGINKRPQWEELLDFWKQNKDIIVRDYVNKTWPLQFADQQYLKTRLEDNDRSAWLVLLLLGYLQSIGRSRSETHRNFVRELLEKHKFLFTEKIEKDDPQWLFPLSKWQDANIATTTYALWMTCFPALHQLGRFLERYQNILGSMVRGGLDRTRLLDCFSPRAAYTFQQAGKQFDAPPFPLRIGKYWVLRELARLNFRDCQSISGEDFLECCWVPRKRCCDILGIDCDEDTDNRQENIVGRLREENGGTLPLFDYCFDIGLCAMR